ncbi:ABC transporter ATP-binding protein [Paenibacillus sp. GCM10023252]|uniref:ABC transporter ATP-binding protein n=1 Tax=Paenibacillus sp. GCM10023252 TaxID=3252649 RepID=UPI00361C2FDE
MPPSALPSGSGYAAARGKPVMKPANFKGTLARLWTYIGKERGRLGAVFTLILVNALVLLLVPYFIGRSIDAMAPGPGEVDWELLQLVLAVLLTAYAVDAVLSFLQGWLMAGIAQRIVRSLRTAMFDKLQKLPLLYFDTHRHGEVMSRLSNDTDNVSTTISQSITQLITGSIAIVGSLVMMLVLSPLLTLACLLTVPLVYLLARTVTKRTSRLFKAQQSELGHLSGLMEETISGLTVVKAFNREEKVIQEFKAGNDRLTEVGTKAQIWSGFMMPLLGVINNLGFAAVALVGGILAVQEMITIGVIASFLSYSRQFVRPLNELANMFNVLQSGLAGAERVFEVLDESEEVSDEAGSVELVHPRGEVIFDQVSFGYKPGEPVLRDISFRASAGTRTAIVGPTGAGKTTIVNLMTRFYELSGGKVMIDGRDIREYTRGSLRQSFGIVLQDTYLFRGTIKENIRYGKEEASEEEIVRAARMANADGFIRRLPMQYDTLLSENGGNLSQGQRQLLAITRVLLAQPSILILDEATSSIDTRTELHIQDALHQIMKGRTTFIIAHRLNTIRDADSIMVIDRGAIVEQGTHDELILQEGVYRQMFYNQFKNLQQA